MIKSALTIYRKNIWNVFALIGFVSLGVLIGIFVVLPTINNLIYISFNRVVSSVSGLGTTGFDVNEFMKSLNNQIGGLDWANPIRTIKLLFENQKLFSIVIKALQDAKLDLNQIESISEQVLKHCNFLINGVYTQIYIFISCVAVTSIIGYLATKIVVQIRSTSDKNVIRFILSFILNLASFVLVYFLLLLSIVNLQGASLFFAVLAIFIMILLMMLAIAIICYKKKEIRLFDILNLKNALNLLLSSLIVFAISFVLFVIIFIFSDLIALLILLPLIFITTIVVENIVIADVTTNLYKKINSKTKN